MTIHEHTCLSCSKLVYCSDPICPYPSKCDCPECLANMELCVRHGDIGYRYKKPGKYPYQELDDCEAYHRET